MAAVQGTSEGDEEGENNLKEHLSNCGFTEYNKISTAVKRADITYEDLIECTKDDLLQICTDYGIKAIQKNRFIKAIQKLPNSMAVNDNNNENSRVMNSNRMLGKKEFVLINASEQETLSKLENLTQFVTESIKNINEIQEKTVADSDEMIAKFHKFFENLINHVKTIETDTTQQV